MLSLHYHPCDAMIHVLRCGTPRNMNTFGFLNEWDPVRTAFYSKTLTKRSSDVGAYTNETSRADACALLS
jgi:hypothetical protein